MEVECERPPTHLENGIDVGTRVLAATVRKSLLVRVATGRTDACVVLCSDEDLHVAQLEELI